MERRSDNVFFQAPSPGHDIKQIGRCSRPRAWCGCPPPSERVCPDVAAFYPADAHEAHCVAVVRRLREHRQKAARRAGMPLRLAVERKMREQSWWRNSPKLS